VANGQERPAAGAFLPAFLLRFHEFLRFCRLSPVFKWQPDGCLEEGEEVIKI